MFIRGRRILGWVNTYWMYKHLEFLLLKLSHSNLNEFGASRVLIYSTRAKWIRDNTYKQASDILMEWSLLIYIRTLKTLLMSINVPRQNKNWSYSTNTIIAIKQRSTPPDVASVCNDISTVCIPYVRVNTINTKEVIMDWTFNTSANIKTVYGR